MEGFFFLLLESCNISGRDLPKIWEIGIFQRQVIESKETRRCVFFSCCLPTELCNTYLMGVVISTARPDGFKFGQMGYAPTMLPSAQLCTYA